MRHPLAFRNLHMGKSCLKGGLFRRAGIDSKADFLCPFPQVADPHLLKIHAILGTLDTEVRFPAA